LEKRTIEEMSFQTFPETATKFCGRVLHTAGKLQTEEFERRVSRLQNTATMTKQSEDADGLWEHHTRLRPSFNKLISWPFRFVYLV